MARNGGWEVHVNLADRQFWKETAEGKSTSIYNFLCGYLRYPCASYYTSEENVLNFFKHSRPLCPSKVMSLTDDKILCVNEEVKSVLKEEAALGSENCQIKFCKTQCCFNLLLTKPPNTIPANIFGYMVMLRFRDCHPYMYNAWYNFTEIYILTCIKMTLLSSSSSTCVFQ